MFSCVEYVEYMKLSTLGLRAISGNIAMALFGEFVFFRDKLVH